MPFLTNCRGILSRKKCRKMSGLVCTFMAERKMKKTSTLAVSAKHTENYYRITWK
jgi:hypothetical protein